MFATQARRVAVLACALALVCAGQSSAKAKVGVADNSPGVVCVADYVVVFTAWDYHQACTRVRRGSKMFKRLQLASILRVIRADTDHCAKGLVRVSGRSTPWVGTRGIGFCDYVDSYLE